MLATLRSFVSSGFVRTVFDLPTTDHEDSSRFASFARVWVGLLAWLFLYEAITGFALMTIYSPSSQGAWSSVVFLEQHVRGGRFLRSSHHLAAQWMVILSAIQFAHVMFAGMYRRPHGAGRWAGALGILALVIGMAHTGALLPWDQNAYWISRVEAGIASTVPVVGPFVQKVFQGGKDLSTLSVTRMYMLHVALLPLLIVLLWGFRAGLSANKKSEEQESSAGLDAVTVAAMQSVLALLSVLVIAFMARSAAAPLDGPADPASDYPARPEWYFLWLFRLRKSFDGPKEIIATVVIPGIATTFLLALPWLDAPVGKTRRWALLIVAGLMGAGVGLLTLASKRADQGDKNFVTARNKAVNLARRAKQLAQTGVGLEGPLDLVQNDPATRPAALYGEQCAGCHAPANTPVDKAKAPALEGFASRGWARALLLNPEADPLFARTDIHEMPSQAKRLGPDGVTAVAEYLYAQSIESDETLDVAQKPDPALVAKGDELFHTKCTTCHLGEGDKSETDISERDAPDLTGWGTRAWIRRQIVMPDSFHHYGRRNTMPSFLTEVTPRDVEMLVRYVRALRSGVAPEVQAPIPKPEPPPEPEEENPPPEETADDGGVATDGTASDGQ